MTLRAPISSRTHQTVVGQKPLQNAGWVAEKHRSAKVKQRLRTSFGTFCSQHREVELRRQWVSCSNCVASARRRPEFLVNPSMETDSGQRAKERRARHVRLQFCRDAVRIASHRGGDGCRRAHTDAFTQTAPVAEPPVIEYVAPAPVVSFAATARVIEFVAPAPAIAYTAPSPVTEYVALAPADAYAAPAPVTEYVTPTPTDFLCSTSVYD